MRLLPPTLFALVLLHAVSASAQSASADVLINRGLELREQGDDAHALEMFELAYRTEPSPRALAQIGMAEASLGQWASGYRKLAEAMSHTEDTWIASRRSALQGTLDTARQHVAFVRVSGGAPPMHVWIGGHDEGLAPIATEIVVPIGRVDVELREGDRVLDQERHTVEPGSTLEVTLSETPDEPRPIEDVDATPRSPLVPALGWTSLSVGVAGLVVGGVLQLVRTSATEHANECITPIGLDTGCTSAEHTARVDAVPGSASMIASYVVGATLTVTGAVLLVVAMGGGETETAPSAFRCAPSVGVWGAACGGSF